MEESFYRAFEEKHRGSRELIKSRLEVYLPFVLHCRELYEECRILDLGCGRGEWLELMMENDFRPFGVDLDEGMLAACRERNISVEKKDLLVALKEHASASLAVVSAFHVVEHLPFEVLQEVIKECLRVLKPGGLLILETPNPENILVATSNFYLDPTHIRPIPPLLLTFLTDLYGFKRTKLLRLQESKELLKSGKGNLLDVLGGVSPDYAVVAQKKASQVRLALFDVAFEKEYGLSLEGLGKRYEEGMEKSFRSIEAKLQQSEATGDEKLRAIEAKLQQSEATGDEKLRAIEAKLQQSEATLKAVYESRSWRITAPLRFLGRSAKWFVKKSKETIKSVTYYVEAFIIRHQTIEEQVRRLTLERSLIQATSQPDSSVLSNDDNTSIALSDISEPEAANLPEIQATSQPDLSVLSNDDNTSIALSDISEPEAANLSEIQATSQPDLSVLSNDANTLIASSDISEPEAVDLSVLSLNARRVYIHLETALEQKKKEQE